MEFILKDQISQVLTINLQGLRFKVEVYVDGSTNRIRQILCSYYSDHYILSLDFAASKLNESLITISPNEQPTYKHSTNIGTSLKFDKNIEFTVQPLPTSTQKKFTCPTSNELANFKSGIHDNFGEFNGVVFSDKLGFQPYGADWEFLMMSLHFKGDNVDLISCIYRKAGQYRLLAFEDIPSLAKPVKITVSPNDRSKLISEKDFYFTEPGKTIEVTATSEAKK